MIVAYDMTPARVGSSGVARYTVDLGVALDRIEGIRLARLAAPDLGSGRATGLAGRAARRLLFYPRNFGAQVERAGADLVHCPGPMVPRNLDRPLVLTVHDLLPWRFPELHSRRENSRSRTALRRAARRANRIIVGTEYTRGEAVDLLEVDPDRVRVAPWGLDLRFHPVESTPMWLARRFGIPGPYILATGTREPQKNLVTLITAFERFQLLHPEYTLVVAGGRPESGTAIETAMNRSSARIVRAGFVSDEELVRLYGSAVCFAFPSLYEGFGFPPLEAMACGTPVVCSDRTSLPEIVGDAALLVDPTDADLLADAIARLALSPAAAAELRDRGRERARSFNWNRCAQGTAEIYREALEEGVTLGD